MFTLFQVKKIFFFMVLVIYNNPDFSESQSVSLQMRFESSDGGENYQRTMT